jgi:hypothetical protein
MKRRPIALSVAAVVAAVTLCANAQVITSIERRNPKPGSAVSVRIAPGPLKEGAVVFADRTHIYRNVPPALVGAQYIMTAMEDKDNPSLELRLTIGQPGTLYLILDNRVGTNVRSQTATPNPTVAGMTWMNTLGFTNTGLKMAIDESANGSIDNYFSVFSLAVTAGQIVLRAQNDRSTGGPWDRNMYGVAATAGLGKATQPVPADGEQKMIDSMLTWTPGAQAVAHNVYLGTTLQLGPADLVGPQLQGPSFLLTERLIPGVTYYWRVDEIGPDGVTVAQGEVWSFKAAFVTAFDPIPADGTRWVDPNLVLRWQAGQDAVAHDLYFGTDPCAVGQGAEGTFQGTCFDTSGTSGILDPDRTYFWRVDEVGSEGGRRTGPVWSFTTLPLIGIGDPNLLAWWKMDEGAGTRIVDWSGHGRHAVFGLPAPTWAQGTVGGALRCAGNGDSAFYEDASFLNGRSALTLAAWIKAEATHTDRGFLVFEIPNGGDNVGLRYDAEGINGGGRDVIKAGLTVSAGGVAQVCQLESSNNAQTTDWQHVALVWSSGQALALYLNGQLDSPTAIGAPATGTSAGFATALIGRGGKDMFDSSWQGLIDEIRLYDRALTPEEIRIVMEDKAGQAHDPDPPDGGSINGMDFVALTWQAGDKAVAHDVYLGPDQAAVSAATPADVTGLYRGRQGGTSHVPAPPLVWGGRYFWRIDEIRDDGSTRPGPVWSFVLGD